MPTFGEWLATQRNSRGWSQKELAAQLKVDLRTITRLETNEGPPNSNNLERIAQFFGEEKGRLKALLQGRPLPERSDRLRVRAIEVDDATAGQIVGLASAAGMSAGEWLEKLVKLMGLPLAAVLNMNAGAGPPPGMPRPPVEETGKEGKNGRE